MIAALLGFGFAVIIFALVAEADSLWLQITGGIMGVIFTLSSAYTGYKQSRGK